MTSSTPSNAPFASGALAHFHAWRKTRRSDHFLVTTTLRSGVQFHSIGLQFSASDAFPGSVMLVAAPKGADQAFVVRDDDILHLHFEPIPEEIGSGPSPFGFGAYVRGDES